VYVVVMMVKVMEEVCAVGSDSKVVKVVGEG